MKNRKEKLLEVIKNSEIGKKAEIHITKKLYETLINRLTIKIIKLFK